METADVSGADAPPPRSMNRRGSGVEPDRPRARVGHDLPSSAGRLVARLVPLARCGDGRCEHPRVTECVASTGKESVVPLRSTGSSATFIEILPALVVWQLQDIDGVDRERRRCASSALPFSCSPPTSPRSRSTSSSPPPIRGIHSLGSSGSRSRSRAMFALAPARPHGPRLGSRVLQDRGAGDRDRRTARDRSAARVCPQRGGWPLEGGDPAAVFVTVFNGAREGWHAVHGTAP
jgi:hypothetical protein